MPYTWQFLAALVVALAIFVLTGLAGASADLGLTRAQVVLITIAVGGLGIVQSVLPRITATPNPDRAGKD